MLGLSCPVSSDRCKESALILFSCFSPTNGRVSLALHLQEVLKLMAQRTTRPSTTGESKEAAGGDGEQGKSTSVRLDSTVSALGMKEEDIVNTRVYNTRIDIGEKEVDEEDEEDDMTGAEDDAVSRDTVRGVKSRAPFSFFTTFIL